jgi:hypothetical protein
VRNGQGGKRRRRKAPAPRQEPRAANAAPPAPAPSDAAAKAAAAREAGAMARTLAADPEAAALVETLRSADKPLGSPEELADLLCLLFAIPGALVDESFELSGPDGRPLPHVRVAAARMYPLLSRFPLGDLAVHLPKLLFAWGLVTLLKPCAKPVADIALGRRQFRIQRTIAESRQLAAAQEESARAEREAAEYREREEARARAIAGQTP